MRENSTTSSQDVTVSFTELLLMFLKGLVSILGVLMLFIMRNRIILGVCVVAGIVLAFVREDAPSRSYRTLLLVQASGAAGNVYEQMSHNLHELIATAPHEEVAHQLKTSEEVAAAIQGISVKSMDGTRHPDTGRVFSVPLNIEISFSDAAKADSVQAAVLRYFNSNDYLLSQRRQKVQLLQQRLAFINASLQKIDSVQMGYSRKLFAAGAALNFNPAGLYLQAEAYYQERQYIKEWLAQGDEPLQQVDVVRSVVSQPSYSRIKHIIIYVLVSFLVGCLLAALREGYLMEKRKS